jgi:hypothetical protein
MSTEQEEGPQVGAGFAIVLHLVEGVEALLALVQRVVQLTGLQINTDFGPTILATVDVGSPTRGAKVVPNGRPTSDTGRQAIGGAGT